MHCPSDGTGNSKNIFFEDRSSASENKEANAGVYNFYLHGDNVGIKKSIWIDVRFSRGPIRPCISKLITLSIQLVSIAKVTPHVVSAEPKC